MQTVMTESMGSIAEALLSEQMAQKMATDYVRTQLGETYTVVSGAYYFSKPHEQMLWRFFVLSGDGPIGALYVDPETAQVLPWTTDEMRGIREKAAILHGQRSKTLVRDENGLVLREYARKQATAYLSTRVGLQFIATNPLFLQLAPPVWQCSIELRLPRRGTIGVFGTIDVNADTGEVIPLDENQIQQIWIRGNAALEFCPQTSTL